MTGQSNKYDDLFNEKQEEIQIILEEYVKKFRDQLTGIIKDVWENIESDYVPYLQENLFINLRERVKESIEYSDIAGKSIRDKIFREHKDEIINDINQNNLERIKNLEEVINRLNRLYF
ncbi:MAG: hypothetical protein KKE05_04820 [Nanoarchaeota archaeon]|nr:hypothetical protein [Nanoarchaeota archaeon]